MAERDRRLLLHEKLCTLLGTRNVYFDPPESIKISYPCIIYNKSTKDSRYADDRNYLSRTRYTVTYIDYSPDSDFTNSIINEFKYCNSDRFYSESNLHHYVFTLYW